MHEPPVSRRPKAAPASGMNRRLPEALDFYLQWHHIEGHTPATVRHYKKSSSSPSGSASVAAARQVLTKDLP